MGRNIGNSRITLLYTLLVCFFIKNFFTLVKLFYFFVNYFALYRVIVSMYSPEDVTLDIMNSWIFWLSLVVVVFLCMLSGDWLEHGQDKAYAAELNHSFYAVEKTETLGLSG